MIRSTARRAATLAAAGALAGAGWLSAAAPALAADTVPGTPASHTLAAAGPQNPGPQTQTQQIQTLTQQGQQMPQTDQTPPKTDNDDWCHYHHGLLGGLLHVVVDILEGLL